MRDEIFAYIESLDAEALASLESDRFYPVSLGTRSSGAGAHDQHQAGFVVDTENLEPFACLCPDGSRCGWDCRDVSGRRYCACDCSNCG